MNHCLVFIKSFDSQTCVFFCHSLSAFIHCRFHHIRLLEFSSNRYSRRLGLPLVENFEFNFSNPWFCNSLLILIMSILFIVFPLILFLFINFIKEAKNRTSLRLQSFSMLSTSNVERRTFTMNASKMISHSR